LDLRRAKAVHLRPWPDKLCGTKKEGLDQRDVRSTQPRFMLEDVTKRLDLLAKRREPEKRGAQKEGSPNGGEPEWRACNWELRRMDFEGNRESILDRS
jgi:hypothetical protein